MEPLRFPEDKISARAKAFKIIKEKSFSLGDYVLASGKRSKYYLDMKPAMLSPEGSTALAELILERKAYFIAPWLAPSLPPRRRPNSVQA